MANAESPCGIKPKEETNTGADCGESRNGFIRGGENVADAYYPRLQGRISRILQERASERIAWSGDPSGVADPNSEPPQWIAESRMQRDPWIVEPYVGRRFDGLSSWMDGLDMTQSHKLLMTYADAKKERPEEILSALRSGIAPADVWQSFGRSGSVSTQEILFAYVCKLEENHINKTRIQLEGAKTSEDGLRSLRSYQKSASASYGSGHKKQRREQHPDTLQALSRFLAYHAEKAWVDYCRENAIPYGWEEGISRIAEGVPARVDRIKALGNAIVPQIAQVIGQAIMDYEHDWEEVDSQFSNESFTDVRCTKCGEVGERNEKTGGVFWPAT
jgi:site-specific DNA-cytosine methylase